MKSQPHGSREGASLLLLSNFKVSTGKFVLFFCFAPTPSLGYKGAAPLLTPLRGGASASLDHLPVVSRI
jgi:hypothetical protein